MKPDSSGGRFQLHAGTILEVDNLRTILMKTTRYVIAFALIILAQPAIAQGQGNGPPTDDVNVVNTPDVNVANTPDVVVANTKPNPVPTAPAGEPYQADAYNFDGPASGLGASITLSNPGKRLEIQHVSVSTLADAGAQVSCDIAVIEGNLFVGGHELVVTFQGALIGGDKYVGSTPIVLFAADGATVRVACSSIGTPGALKIKNVRGAISGLWRDD